MSPLASAARALADHPWLDGAWAGSTGALLLLSRQGQAEFHREGRQSLLDALQSQLATRDLAVPGNWRLLDAPPQAADHATIERLLATPPAPDHTHRRTGKRGPLETGPGAAI